MTEKTDERIGKKVKRGALNWDRKRALQRIAIETMKSVNSAWVDWYIHVQAHYVAVSVWDDPTNRI